VVTDVLEELAASIYTAEVKMEAADFCKMLVSVNISII
jgi:hypothetical protein